MKVEPKKYEASLYYRRELPEPPPPDELPYELTRLHDIYIEMSSVLDVLGYVKEYIRNPPNDGYDGIGSAFQRVLDDFWIPHKIIDWEPAILTNPDEEKSKFDCVSKPFLHKDGLSCTLKISVQVSKQRGIASILSNLKNKGGNHWNSRVKTSSVGMLKAGLGASLSSAAKAMKFLRHGWIPLRNSVYRTGVSAT